jgi:hypothetical protein
LDKGEQSAVLWAKLIKGVTQGIELLRANRARGFGNVFVLGRERRKYPAKLLATEVINAGVAREAK